MGEKYLWMSVRALEHGQRPTAYSTFTGATITSLSTPEAETAALAHVLGIVREPMNWFRPTSSLARPLLLASLSMVAAAVKASASTLRAAVCVSRRRTLLHRAIGWLRYSTWTRPKPAGLPCRCCAIPGSHLPGVHVRRSRRPIDGIGAALAVRGREGLRANGPAHISSLRAHTFRIRDEADLASSTAYRASFALLQISADSADAAAAASVRADDAAALAEALEVADLPSIDERADADRAIAAHRAAVIAAANTATRHTAALDHSHACNARAHLVSRFACWAAQTISGLVLEGQRAAVRMAGTTALQDLLAEVAGRRREAHDTAARIRDFARARRAAVLAARQMGGTRMVHVRGVTLLLAGDGTTARACAPPRPQPQLTARPHRYYRVTLGGSREGLLLPPPSAD